VDYNLSFANQQFNRAYGDASFFGIRYFGMNETYFRFLENYDKILYGLKHTLTLIRKSDDAKEYIWYKIKTVKTVTTPIRLWMLLKKT